MGSGIASASRKPIEPRASLLKNGQAGYLSPRHLCTHNIIPSGPIMRAAVRGKIPDGQGHSRRAVQMPVNKADRQTWACCDTQ